MNRPRALTAGSAPAELELAAVAGDVDVRRRTITGLLLPSFGTGSTSAGPTRFVDASSVAWHPDVRRVKLLREHNRDVSLGYALELEWTSAGLFGTFHVPESPEGDRALADAASGIRDGLSVGVVDIRGDFDRDGVLVVEASRLREVSLVSVPAFDDSRVSAVIASQRGTQRMFTDAQLAALRAAGIDPTDEGRARAYLTSLSAGASSSSTSSSSTSGSSSSGAVQGLTAADVADELMERLTAGGIVPPAPLEGPNGGGSGSGSGSGVRELNLSAFVELVRGRYAGIVPPAELSAALADIVPADAPGAFRPAYLDELWEGAEYRRRFIETAMTPRPLGRTMKIIGQRWQVKPEVDDYAGDKTAVPSNPDVALVDVPVDVKRLAGAHDVDRAYVDLGSPEWLSSYFEAQTESYKRKSDARAATIVMQQATPLVEDATDEDANPATFTTLLEGIVDLAVTAASAGEGLEYVAMAPGLVRALFEVSNMDAPAWFSGSFQLGGGGGGALGGVTFTTSPGITAQKFVGGVKSASRWHELPTPIRVQALNVANGGIDLGVFGYYAGYVRNPLGVYVGTVA